MNKPVLVVMAAGMGSRYGGMKQIDGGAERSGDRGLFLYDARRAGFETVIFVIKHEIEDAFKAAIGERVSKAMNVKYAFQQLMSCPQALPCRRAVSSPGAPATPFWLQRTSSTARLRSSMPMIITARRPSG